MITSAERARLKSISIELKDLVYVGKEGLTENVIAQINDNLYAHELIKIKVQRGYGETNTKLAKEICDACGCELVGVIGNKILVYKYTEKPKFAHLIDKYKFFVK